MIHQLNMHGKDKVQVAIERLQMFEPKEEGYYLAFSGGKDSVVIKALAEMAGVKYDAHYNLTSVDPPELVQFIKTFDDVQIDIPKDKDGKQITMWNLIPKKKLPPTHLARYCCAYLKETGGKGRMIITGVRWAESANRRKNQGYVTVYKGNTNVNDMLTDSGHFKETEKGGVVLNNDNEQSRKLVEQCYKLSQTVINPIIDWTDEDVWEFIHEYNIPYCKLYDEGNKRLGCIGCPMSTHQVEELERYPKYKQAYIRAFQRMLDSFDRPSDWATGEEVYEWWVRDWRHKANKDNSQIDLNAKGSE